MSSIREMGADQTEIQRTGQQVKVKARVSKQNKNLSPSFMFPKETNVELSSRQCLLDCVFIKG